ncbi:DUF1611 domain-containing protein [Kordiimonas sp.]|uniref:DUF1611 domain-containing protein n=1 Tax=Kordiimonas sp. TaxID=1970157 RepID=UPI003A8E37A0
MANKPIASLPLVQIELRQPYVIYVGDIKEIAYAKTGLGLVEWRKEMCFGQLRHDEGCTDLGIRDVTVAAAAKAGVGSIIIGVAPSGGRLSESWLNDLTEAATLGIDIVSGMHEKLSAFPGLVAAAKKSGARLIDIRTPPTSLPIGTGIKRRGKRLLTVGTDCAVGKKYTALALEKEMHARNMPADFRATGQTGIMIAGQGIPIDSVVSDFISGAAEVISPDASSDDHWDLIEGQGALTNPSYAGVSLGLLHGSQPDALVLCHDPHRKYHLGSTTYGLVSITEAIDTNLIMARRVNPSARFVGVAINSSAMTKDERTSFFQQCSDETGLPVVDPLLTGTGPIVDHILSQSW